VPLELVPARDELFAQQPTGAPVVPENGQIIVVGRFDGADFAIERTDQITVLAPGGRALPLRIESDSIYREFDRIVSLRLCFTAADEAESRAPGAFKLEWGADVKADNVLTGPIALDPARKDAYREFRWRQKPAAPATGAGQGASVATIEVIADTTAEYHFLWYLLPITLIFILLTIRKIRARNTTHRPAA
jgi:hypothetical protein